MNEFKYILEIEGFGNIVNFKTDLVSVNHPPPQRKLKEFYLGRIHDKYTILFYMAARRHKEVSESVAEDRAA